MRDDYREVVRELISNFKDFDFDSEEELYYLFSEKNDILKYFSNSKAKTYEIEKSSSYTACVSKYFNDSVFLCVKRDDSYISNESIDFLFKTDNGVVRYHYYYRPNAFCTVDYTVLDKDFLNTFDLMDKDLSSISSFIYNNEDKLYCCDVNDSFKIQHNTIHKIKDNLYWTGSQQFDSTSRFSALDITDKFMEYLESGKDKDSKFNKQYIKK